MYMHELVGDGLDRTGDVLIERRVTRLKHRGVVFLPSHKYLCGVYLADIEDGMDCDLD